jgi:SSS family transporter
MSFAEAPTIAPFDLVVVVVYVVGTTLLGVWFARNQKDVRTYFVGDRDVAWWLVLVSIVATETSTVTFLSVPGLAYGKPGNLTFLQLAIGYVVGRVVVAAVLLPQYFRGELFSAYQLLRTRYTPAVQRTASGLFLITRTLADGLRLYLTALLLRQFTGWETTTAILVMGAVTLVYTYLGGMQAVIWTDLIQFAVYIAGAVVAAVCLIQLLPGGWDAYWTFARDSGRLRVFNGEFNPADAYTFWAGLIGGAFVTMASHGADQLMVQRYLCARSLRQARGSLIASGVVVFVQFLLFLLIGVGLASVVSAGVLSIPAGTRQDEVFGRFIVAHLPVGVVGLVIAAVLAAAMSTLSSSLNASANALVTDFYRPLRPECSETHLLTLSKLLTAGFGFAQMGVALAADRLDSPTALVEQVMAVAGFTTGPVLALFLLGSIRPVRGPAALAGLVFGFLSVCAVWLSGRLGGPTLAWPWFAPVGTITAAAAALAVDGLSSQHGSPDYRSA